MTGSGMRSPEMRKKRRLRSVCAPHSRAAGTSIGPKLSFSMRMAAIPAAMLRANGGQVEEQHIGALARRELERALVGLERVARREALAVDADGAARDMHVRHAAGAELVARLGRARWPSGLRTRRGPCPGRRGSGWSGKNSVGDEPPHRSLVWPRRRRRRSSFFSAAGALEAGLLAGGPRPGSAHWPSRAPPPG